MKLTKVITKPNSKWTKYQRITFKKKKQRTKKKKEKHYGIHSAFPYRL
jgi:hypothetical protein